MLSYLTPLNGSKLGIVLFDFYESEPDVVAAVAGVTPPPTTPVAANSTTGSSYVPFCHVHSVLTPILSTTHTASGAAAYRWPALSAFSLFGMSLVLAFW
jgi:hypothetical protein